MILIKFPCLFSGSISAHRVWDHAGNFQVLGQEKQLLYRPEAVQGSWCQGSVQETGEHAEAQSLVRHPAVLWWDRRTEGEIEKGWEALGSHKRSHQLPKIQATKNLSIIQFCSNIDKTFKTLMLQTNSFLTPKKLALTVLGVLIKLFKKNYQKWQ